MTRRGIVAGALALAFALLSSWAFAQVNPGTSPLSILKGGTGGATAAAARANIFPAHFYPFATPSGAL